MLSTLASKLVTDYLDDITLREDETVVAADVFRIQTSNSLSGRSYGPETEFDEM